MTQVTLATNPIFSDFLPPKRGRRSFSLSCYDFDILQIIFYYNQMKQTYPFLPIRPPSIELSIYLIYHMRMHFFAANRICNCISLFFRGGERGKRRSPRLGVSSSCIPYLSTLFNPPPSAPVDCRLITHV